MIYNSLDAELNKFFYVDINSLLSFKEFTPNGTYLKKSGKEKLIQYIFSIISLSLTNNNEFINKNNLIYPVEDENSEGAHSFRLGRNGRIPGSPKKVSSKRSENNTHPIRLYPTLPPNDNQCF